MPSKEVHVSRAEANDPRETLKARVQAEFTAALEKKAALQIAEVPYGLPFQWNVFAVGPYQNPFQAPGRIIAVGQQAFIVTIVFMNELMCQTVESFEADVLLNYWTSNTQTMQPVPALSGYSCLEADMIRFPGFGCFTIDVYTITPTQEACLLETNICAMPT